MRLNTVEQVNFPSLSLLTMPGLISISCPTLSTPLNIDPPATPPRNSSTSDPGLFTFLMAAFVHHLGIHESTLIFV